VIVQLRRMAKRRRIGEFPQNVVCDQRLPSPIVVDERLDVLLQEVGSDCHPVVLGVGQTALHDTSCGPSGRNAGEVGFGFAVANGRFTFDGAFPWVPSGLGDLFQRHRVHAVPQATGSGTIGEYVAQMGVAGVAYRFNSFQERRSVKAIRNCILFDRLSE
jgi:hypothetical protein